MREDFLHYLWKHKTFNFSDLKTINGESVILIKSGVHNNNAGPDFFNARLKIANQLWAGNVEMHLKSSDWYAHGHEADAAYDNVILHVVWEDNMDVFRKDNTKIPVLELKNYVQPSILNTYKTLLDRSEKWINCEQDFASIDDFVLKNWLERLYFERLERKFEAIQLALETSKYNWEAILFTMLAKNFGLKVNGSSFLSLANSFEFSIIRKLQDKQYSIEALLFGQGHLLNNDDIQEVYYKKLQSEYKFLKQKFNLSNDEVQKINFFRLRPFNFPTIRLSQLANLYSTHHNLFSRVIAINSKQDFYDLLSVKASSFWDTHYTFNKTTKSITKKISKPFIDLLLINTIIPLKFGYAKHYAKPIGDTILQLVESIKSERNSTITSFNALKKTSKNALQSQALLQLKNEYCDKYNCLQCAVGHSILK